MIKKIDHIGIAVADISAAKDLYRALLNVTEFHEETVEDRGVQIASFLIGDVRIELTAALDSSSPIAGFITKRGEGIHHLAFKSDDLQNDLDALDKNGIKLINSSPVDGAHNMKIAFAHPKSTGGVLMEFCAEKN